MNIKKYCVNAKTISVRNQKLYEWKIIESISSVSKETAHRFRQSLCLSFCSDKFSFRIDKKIYQFNLSEKRYHSFRRV